jgi:hypothetical protein
MFLALARLTLVAIFPAGNLPKWMSALESHNGHRACLQVF